MSFILDALKKSEAERRQGEVPTLQNEIDSSAPRRRSVWPYLLSFALLLNVAMVGGWLLFRQEKPPVVATASGEFDLLPSSPSVRPEPAEELTPTPAPPATERTLSTAAVKPVQEPTARPERPAASPRAESAPARATGSSPQPEPKQQPAPADAIAVAGTPEPSRKTGTAQPPQPIRQVKPVQPANPVKTGAPTGNLPASVPAKAAPPAPEKSFPLLSELPADVRSGLPGLNLQLHFFSPDPARRLVRLNGFNLREGDRGGEGLSVVEITPDGIRLSCRGVRFFLPTVRR